MVETLHSSRHANRQVKQFVTGSCASDGQIALCGWLHINASMSGQHSGQH
jgi:hypothetical protein